MPSFASGLVFWTAWASTCAALWRRIDSPSGLEMSTPSTTCPSARTVSRSRSSPSMRRAMTEAVPAKSSVPVVPSSMCWGDPSRVRAIWATCCSLRVGVSRPTMPAPRAILSGRAGVLVPRPGRLRGGSGDGQAQGEGGALPVPGLEGRSAAVALEDRADERQAEPGPLDAARLAGAAQLLPHRLELVGGDAVPGVGDLEEDHAVLLAAADLDRVLLLGVLHGVAQCVGEDEVEQVLVADERRQGSRRPGKRDGDPAAACTGQLRHRVDRLLDEGGGVDRGELERGLL